METLAERIKYARKVTDMSPAEFARAIGVGRAAVSKMEKGQTKTISLEAAIAIQKLTGISVSWLGTGKGSIEHTDLKDQRIARIARKLNTLRGASLDKVESEADFLLSIQDSDQ